MQYWINDKNECGTMDREVVLPDGFKKTTKKKYDVYVSTQEKQAPESSDIEKLIKWAKKQGYI